MDQSLDHHHDDDGTCCEWEHDEPATQRTTRRKLWEVTPRYMCSVVGTCLRVDEIRKQAQRDKLCAPDLSDYDLHGLIVGFCKSRSRTSRALHKILERRYAGAIRQASSAKTADALRAWWKEALDAGRVAEGYWALISHPVADSALIDEAFGDVHMLSHVLGASRRDELRQLDQAQASAADAEQKLRALRRALRTENTAREAAETRCAEQVHAIDRLRQALEEGSELDDALDRALARIDALEQELIDERERREAAERGLRRLRGAHEDLEARTAELEGEVDALEDEARAADAQLTELLSGTDEARWDVDLAGQRVLYVGGRTGLLRHYREMVERSDGAFAHHDGGIEVCITRVDKQVHGADIVLCAMDAVSHDASLRVKLACRRFGRRFVPLRSSGVASLGAALRDLRCMGPDGPGYDGPTAC